MQTYDVVVIGSGTGGQTAAYDLKKAGLRVALAEGGNQLGGTCALSGCQPKKWFYEVAEVIAKSHHLKSMGITTPAQGDWHAVWRQKEAFVENVHDNTVNGLLEAGIDFLEGMAAFKSADMLHVSDDTVTADFFVIATGARPMALPFPGADHLITSTAFLESPDLPRRILFVGGGFISFEFAHFAARIGPGNREMTILEAGERPLNPFDADMVDLLLDASARDGIAVINSVRIEAVDRRNDVFFVRTDSGRIFEADMVVHGAGRVPNIESLGLATFGVETNKAGIQVNAHMQTTVPHLFAVGDCAATPALARVADFEAHVAAENILALRRGLPLAAIDYNAVPFMLFSYPQYGMVGETEAALKKKGIAYRKSTAVRLQWPTYRRIGMQHAGYKILAGEKNTLLGAHILSDNASGLINTFRQAMIDATPIETLYRRQIMSPYPSRESDILYMLGPLLR